MVETIIEYVGYDENGIGTVVVRYTPEELKERLPKIYRLLHYTGCGRISRDYRVDGKIYSDAYTVRRMHPQLGEVIDDGDPEWTAL